MVCGCSERGEEVSWWQRGGLMKWCLLPDRIVKAQETEFVVESVEVIAQPVSAQLAELLGLTQACLLAEQKRVT